jgi:hypothetical protein
MAKWLSAASIEYAPRVGLDLKTCQYDLVASAGRRDVKLAQMRLQEKFPGTRFLVTVEKHTGKRAKTVGGKKPNGDYLGLPHFHMFVHETNSEISWRELKRQFDRIGLSECKLVDKNDAKAAWYICKYISKDNGSRNLWPSQRYGRPTKEALHGAEEV